MRSTRPSQPVLWWQLIAEMEQFTHRTGYGLACHKQSTYDAGQDRYFHTHDTENDTCWVHIARGETTR